MKHLSKVSYVSFVIYFFVLLASPLPAQECTAGDLQYRPEGDCDTYARKCCKKKSGTAWGEWGRGECTGTPCPSTCADGLYRNPEVNNEEEGACCVDACQIPEKQNTCECRRYALGPGSCECYKNSPDLIKKHVVGTRCDGYDDPSCEEYYMGRFVLQVCNMCEGFLESQDTRKMCCTSMGGELNRRDNKCYSSRLVWVRNDYSRCSPMLCYSGHCSVMMSPIASQGSQAYPTCKGSAGGYCSKEGEMCNYCNTHKRNDLTQAEHDKWCGKGKTMYSSCVLGLTCSKEEKVIFE